MKRKKPKTKPKYIFSYKIADIKKQKLSFAVTYVESENLETYTDLLLWSEIEKPKSENIQILKMEVFKKEISICKLNLKNSKKLLNILDLYNKTGLIYSEIEPATAPSEKEIIFCISLYFGISPKFTRQHGLYKLYLKQIADKRDFLNKILIPTERHLFNLFLTSAKPKLNISIDTIGKTRIGVYLINKNLCLLMSGIRQDYENGLLAVQEYQKPPTKRDKIKQANEYLKEMGIDAKIPLRKKSKKEIINEWQNFHQNFEEQINEPKA